MCSSCECLSTSPGRGPEEELPTSTREPATKRRFSSCAGAEPGTVSGLTPGGWCRPETVRLRASRMNV